MKRLSLILTMFFIFNVNFLFGQVTIDYASVVQEDNFSQIIAPAVNALDKPDGKLANFMDDDIAITTYGIFSGFGDGDNIQYNLFGFSDLLGVSENILYESDFISIEHNGGSIPNNIFESSNWKFTDGINELNFDHSFYFPSISPPIVGLGIIDNNTYADFFGIPNYFGDNGNMAYILVDIDGYSNVDINSDQFKVVLKAYGENPNSPDPDIMGRISAVPEPITMLLFAFGALFFKKFIYKRSESKH